MIFQYKTTAKLCALPSFRIPIFPYQAYFCLAFLPTIVIHTTNATA